MGGGKRLWDRTSDIDLNCLSKYFMGKIRFRGGKIWFQQCDYGALDRVLDGQPNELGLLESSGKKFCENAEETDAV